MSKSLTSILIAATLAVPVSMNNAGAAAIKINLSNTLAPAASACSTWTCSCASDTTAGETTTTGTGTTAQPKPPVVPKPIPVPTVPAIDLTQDDVANKCHAATSLAACNSVSIKIDLNVRMIGYDPISGYSIQGGTFSDFNSACNVDCAVGKLPGSEMYAGTWYQLPGNTCAALPFFNAGDSYAKKCAVVQGTNWNSGSVCRWDAPNKRCLTAALVCTQDSRGVPTMAGICFEGKR